ncbi:tRNA pseudouridine synthase A [Luteitalea pratensis]|uniref:tRNA pseudouridine synthase A n=1 Tax=Luteitalea pratensis TaxID=1855912 RepID=A0A143PG15_LUTPR|nr:tRNA pseudouridine(38-40) synthase TruA [Luteitalea pratensis]AMY07497.1 tRNA pseudouridine synthase A [Luteitalea pratensis]
MPRVLLRVAYDGTAYAGWQRQENGPSIQAALEQALSPLAGGAATVTGAGRTDAGVHADGQAAHVDLPEGIDPDVVVRATNTRLPADIRVRSAALVPDDFHARFAAVSKTYRYAWLVSRVGHPLLARTHWLVSPPLDLAAMAAAAAVLGGTHDFAAFQSTGSPVTSTTRTITGVDLGVRPAADFGVQLSEHEKIVELELRGDGFLRHMVRAIAGTLLEVGYGRRAPDDFVRLLVGAPRGYAGPTAPPHGLTLLRVEYPLTTEERGEQGTRDREEVRRASREE